MGTEAMQFQRANGNAEIWTADRTRQQRADNTRSGMTVLRIVIPALSLFAQISGRRRSRLSRRAGKTVPLFRIMTLDVELVLPLRRRLTASPPPTNPPQMFCRIIIKTLSARGGISCGWGCGIGGRLQWKMFNTIGHGFLCAVSGGCSTPIHSWKI